MAKYVIFAVIAFVVLFPMYWMVSGSFQDTRGLMSVPPKFIPTDPTLSNYRSILMSKSADTRLLLAVFNTVLEMIITVGLHVFVCFTAGYVFALYEFRGKESLFWLFIMAMSVGRYQLIIPQYVLIANIGLTNTLLGAGLPFVFSPMAIFFFRNYLLAIPKSFVDSARIDGAGETRILARVLVPMCRPVFGVLSLFSGLAVVTDYIWPSLVLLSPARRTLYVEIISRMRNAERFVTDGLPKIGLGLAGGTLLLLPMLVVFLLTGRYIIDGLNTGGSKE